MQGGAEVKSAIAIILLLAASAGAQSGGPYVITQSVIAGGGTPSATGATYAVAGTIGQSAAGTESTGGQFRIRGGFWAESPLAPTAASVSFSGRVVLEPRGSLRRIRITAMDLSTGIVRSAVPNTLGYFRFDDLEIGMYLVRIEGRNLQFTPNDFVVTLQDSVAGFEVTGTRAH